MGYNSIIEFSGLPKEDAATISKIAEERLDVGTVPMPLAPTHQLPPKSSIADELTKLAALKYDGIITEEEFEQLKKDLLNSRPSMCYTRSLGKIYN